jgi:hypothetical protein
MLVTPKFPDESQIDKWRDTLRNNGYPDWEYTPPHTLREGVVLGHLNLNHDFKLNNKFHEYPVFHRDDFMIDFYEKNLKSDDISDSSRRYETKELAKYVEVPANIADLYVKEKWWHVWNRETSYNSVDAVRHGIGSNSNNAFEAYEPSLGSYGVVDTPEQLLELYDFDADPRRFFICFTPVRKKNESSSGGWRWHKWGEYLGIQSPCCEYIYDEPVIEEVWIYHIYQLEI